jgi:hypothetical protein
MIWNTIPHVPSATAIMKFQNSVTVSGIYCCLLWDSCRSCNPKRHSNRQPARLVTPRLTPTLPFAHPASRDGSGCRTHGTGIPPMAMVLLIHDRQPIVKCRVSDQHEVADKRKIVLSDGLYGERGSLLTPWCPRHGSVTGLGPASGVAVAASGAPESPPTEGSVPGGRKARIGGGRGISEDRRQDGARLGRRGPGSRWPPAYHFPTGQCTTGMPGSYSGPAVRVVGRCCVHSCGRR